MASASRALRLARLHAPLRCGGGASRPLRPVAAAVESLLPAAPRPSPTHARFLSTQPARSSLRDSSTNWNNRPPKETILLDGCDFEHWLVVMEPPPGNPGNPDIPREEIIGGYIKTLAHVVGSEEEARQKIYSVSTRHYFAFGALVSEELSYKLKELPNVRWVLPDSYLDVKNKDYGGEPFIDGQAVPYDPKYHEEWVRNNDRANIPKRRDKPHNIDRSRNIERRRENMQNFENRDATPGRGFSNPPPHQGSRGCHPVMLLLCTMHSPICHYLHQTLVHHLTRQVMHQVADKIISKVALRVTKASPLDIKVVTKVIKVALVATCTVAQALLIRATLDSKGQEQDTRVTAHLRLHSKVAVNPLSKVVTHLLTKVATPAMAPVETTKAHQVTKAITRQVCPPMKGSDLGGITSRTLLEETTCRNTGSTPVAFCYHSLCIYV